MNINDLKPLERWIYRAGKAKENEVASRDAAIVIYDSIKEDVEEYKVRTWPEELERGKKELEEAQEAYTRFSKFQTTIREMALGIFEKTGEKTPNPVVQVKQSKTPRLEVAHDEAVKWAVEKGITKLLKINASKYRDMLVMEAFEDQPGELFPKVSTSFYASRLQAEYERIAEMLE